MYIDNNILAFSGKGKSVYPDRHKVMKKLNALSDQPVDFEVVILTCTADDRINFLAESVEVLVVL